MHELAIAEELMEEIARVASAHEVVRVLRVELQVGAYRQVVPEALESAFEAVSRDTVASGARLAITEVPIRARCRLCGREFEAEIDNYLCPACGKADTDLVAGHEIILASLECDAEQGAPGE